MKAFLFLALSAFLVSEEEIRFACTYKQGYDTSCGIAAAASLLNYYWNIPAAEKDLYREMILDRLSGEEREYTVSFLDIMECMQRAGIASRAYKMDWAGLEDSLGKGYAPVIVNYDKPRPHFVLLTGMEKGFAYAADPARGFGIVDRASFEKDYSGNALLTASRTAVKDAGRVKEINGGAGRKLDALRRLAGRRGMR